MGREEIRAPLKTPAWEANVSCAKKNLLYTISFSARVSLALLSLRKNRGLFVVYISFKVHVILSLMRGRGILQNAEHRMTVP